MADDGLFLGHMLEYALLVQKTLAGRSLEHLIGDRDLLHLAIYRLHVVGEAARNVSEDTRRKYPEIPWSEIIALRNRLVHGYFDINVAVVYNIVDAELPALIASLQKITPTDYQV